MGSFGVRRFGLENDPGLTGDHLRRARVYSIVKDLGRGAQPIREKGAGVVTVYRFWDWRSDPDLSIQDEKKCFWGLGIVFMEIAAVTGFWGGGGGDV